MRIVLVLATSTGGVGRHVAAAARGLAAAGQHVVVAGPSATQQRFGFSGVDFSSGQGNHVRFRAVEIASGWRPLVAFRAAFSLRRLTRGSDIVHAHGFRAAVVTAVALGRWRILRGRRSAAGAGRRPAFVVTLHNAMTGSTSRRRLLEFAMRQVVCRCDAALVVSRDLADVVGGARDVERALVASVLPTPSRDATSVRRELGVPDAAPLLVAVGRLHPQKGFDVLIEAARSLRETVPGSVVVIAGDGPQRSVLQDHIEAAGVDVRLIGDRSDVADLVHAADVVVMPSRWEGWPLAAAEVLGAGRPFVATRVGGLPDLVGDAALLVEPEDPGSLAAALAKVLTDVRLAADLATTARRRAETLPTDGDVVTQLLSCYEHLVGSSR